MKTLLILRHAKSSWDNPGQSDHERPLNKRGRRDAPRMGQLLKNEDLVPDLILCSTAQRARETTAAVAVHANYHREIEFIGDLYHAPPQACINALNNVGSEYERVLLIAHNPGLESLVELLGGHYEPFPTAALAHIQLDVDDWSDLSAHTASTLLNLWRPKELDD